MGLGGRAGYRAGAGVPPGGAGRDRVIHAGRRKEAGTERVLAGAPRSEGACTADGVQGPSLHSHPAAEPRPTPLPSQARFSVKCARAREGKTDGERDDSENI